jgi:hypothetical protein
MTQLKMAIWPDAPPAKGLDKLRRWTAGGHRGCRQGDCRLNGCSPKPSK